ncbi:uncharacterized protein ColSpa_12126 [Colletotrichum spaethianum]|uniref:Methyltransferase domain-containing protein n=1 Tax=Colletotrichum spaethianum TaxID=700344 RepID=A0AA37UQ80_9PEZI|nr:uncharacterized protein ColSpa_12126 [Colletotrichum spaethianum]GKT51945.1 hypothetical protein ColSpa_12126 [Colletotrichum spaethianum]
MSDVLPFRTNTDGQRIQDFQQACRGLLYEVVSEAGVLEDEFLARKLAILDLGIGCGDQSLELAQLIRQSSWDEYSYVGLTLNPSQFYLASKLPFQEFQLPGSRAKAIQVFRADAARPDKWDEDVKSAITSLADEHPENQARWVLALDSLYHFSPDRKPIFNYAAQELDASFMAFDLLLSHTASLHQKLLVKFIGLAMGCPVGAFVTEIEYKKQLSEAGYDGKHVRFRDITDHVFSGLVDHIKRQEEVLRPYGISVGKFRVAGRVFSWFARSKTLRATIVVARNKSKRL